VLLLLLLLPTPMRAQTAFLFGWLRALMSDITCPILGRAAAAARPPAQQQQLLQQLPLGRADRPRPVAQCHQPPSPHRIGANRCSSPSRLTIAVKIVEGGCPCRSLLGWLASRSQRLQRSAAARRSPPTPWSWPQWPWRRRQRRRRRRRRRRRG
jgi:hypothetical protein